jgi:hypothetical protein
VIDLPPGCWKAKGRCCCILAAVSVTGRDPRGVARASRIGAGQTRGRRRCLPSSTANAAFSAHIRRMRARIAKTLRSKPPSANPAHRPSRRGRQRSSRRCGRPIPVKVSFRTCFLARFNVANYDDTEGSSPSGASIAPQTCSRSIREDRNHDAVMRIGGEAPRRRAHSKGR